MTLRLYKDNQPCIKKRLEHSSLVSIREKVLLQSKDVISLSKYSPYNMIAHFLLRQSGYSQFASLLAHN